jgi:hypothetical protein
VTARKSSQIPQTWRPAMLCGFRRPFIDEEGQPGDKGHFCIDRRSWLLARRNRFLLKLAGGGKGAPRREALIPEHRVEQTGES